MSIKAMLRWRSLRGTTHPGLSAGHCGWSCTGCGSGPSCSKHLAKIAAIDPATAAGRAADEILCLALGLMANWSPEDGAAGNV